MESHLKRLSLEDCKDFLNDMAQDNKKPLSIFNKYKCCEYLLQRYPALSNDAEMSAIISKIIEEKVALEEFLPFSEIMAECMIEENSISSSSLDNNNNSYCSDDKSESYDDVEIKLGMMK